MANPNMRVGMPSVNPKGRPSGVFSTFSDTATRLLEELTREQIIAISDDEAELNKFPPFKCLVIRQLAHALQAGKNEPQILMDEREKLYDRVMGKAVSRTELTGKDGANLQINVVTGVNAVDADFEVVGNAIECEALPAPTISSAPDAILPDVAALSDSDVAKREAMRQRAAIARAARQAKTVPSD